jgi:hypothetical protein
VAVDLEKPAVVAHDPVIGHGPRRLKAEDLV